MTSLWKRRDSKDDALPGTPASSGSPSMPGEASVGSTGLGQDAGDAEQGCLPAVLALEFLGKVEGQCGSKCLSNSVF